MKNGLILSLACYGLFLNSAKSDILKQTRINIIRVEHKLNNTAQYFGIPTNLLQKAGQNCLEDEKKEIIEIIATLKLSSKFQVIRSQCGWESAHKNTLYKNIRNSGIVDFQILEP